MPGSRLLWQIWGTLTATVAVSILVLGYLMADRIQQNARNDIVRSLQAQTIILEKLFQPQLIANQQIDVATMIEATEGIAIRITLVNPSGRVLADNREDPGLMDNHSTRPEIIQAKAEKFGQSIRFSKTVNKNMLYVALLVRKGGEVSGFIRVARPLVEIEQQLQELRQQIWFSVFLIGGILLLPGYVLARRFTLPITQMKTIAADMAQGNYSLRLKEDRRDEIGDLAKALNELARATEEQISELTTSRNELAAVLGGLTEGVVAVDIELNVLHVNHSARSMLGIPDDASLMQSLPDIVRIPEINNGVGQCLNEKSIIESTATINDRRVDIIVLPLRGGRELDQGSELAGVIVVLQDVTDVYYLEQVRRDFVANASHELKTPISVIRGFVETIIDDVEMPPDVLRNFIQRTGVQVTRLSKIVQDLIQLSRFDSASSDALEEVINLSQLLSEVRDAVQEDADLADVAINMDEIEDDLMVAGDREALHQMVMNLADNAIKYSRAGGSIMFTLVEDQQQAVLGVKDEGIGIPEQFQQRIFERFYRVDRARSREKGGTGLGLSIVKHIAQKHHGRVEVESQVDKGSTFTVYLPLVSQVP